MPANYCAVQRSCSWTSRIANILGVCPKIDVHAVRRKLQQRRKKSSDTYPEYCYRMLEIGSQKMMAMNAIIQYIIDDIGGDDTSKIILYRAQNIAELKLKFDVFERIKIKSKMGNKADNSQTRFSDKSSDQNGSKVKILKLNNVADKNEILKIDCFAEVNRVDTFHVNDKDVRNEVAKMIDEYEPRKTKEVDMKVRIILKDEVPVS